jgi:hypothetical protein
MGQRKNEIAFALISWGSPSGNKVILKLTLQHIFKTDQAAANKNIL